MSFFRLLLADGGVDSATLTEGAALDASCCSSLPAAWNVIGYLPFSAASQRAAASPESGVAPLCRPNRESGQARSGLLERGSCMP